MLKLMTQSRQLSQLRQFASRRPHREAFHSTLKKHSAQMSLAFTSPMTESMQHQISTYKTKNKRLDNQVKTIRKMIAEKESLLKTASSKLHRIKNFLFRTQKNKTYNRVKAHSKRQERKLISRAMLFLFRLPYSAFSRLVYPKPAENPGTVAKTKTKKYFLKKRRAALKIDIETPRLSKAHVQSIYKVFKEQEEKNKRRESILDRYQALFSTVWYFGILGILFYIYINVIREKVLNRNKQIFKMIDSKVVGVSHKALIENVLQSVVLNEAVAESLISLVNEPKIKKLMTELFIKLLRNPDFVEDTSKLLKKIAIEYLASKDCYEKMVKLIVMEVLRNERVLSQIAVMSREYALGSQQDMLEEKLNGILIGVLQIPEVSQYVCERIADEVGNAFDQGKVQEVAIRVAIQNLKPPPK